MERFIDIDTISDGKKYTASDMVKIGCNDCLGCSSCCTNMEGLITLDPYDIYRMQKGNVCSAFEELLGKNIELTVDKALLVPSLKMDVESHGCTFLNATGRCSIHDSRPGICRLFPMGRLYADSTFYYFLQKDECHYSNKTKVKLKKWIDTPELSKYEKYICDWHYLQNDLKEYFMNAGEEEIKQINTVILQIFYINAYNDDFYADFYSRYEKVKSLIG